MTPTNNRESGELHAMMVALAALAVLGLILTAGLVQLANNLAPRIGDIISFPATKTPSASTASITADPSGVLSRRPCILDVEVMQRLGGSLLIEAVQLKPDRKFQVHWSGVRTSNSSEDCGGSADLLLNNAQIAALVFAAGGRGVKVGEQ
jgi:hypothetical protein